jgi:iron(II)-dependent oxidoreductase
MRNPFGVFGRAPVPTVGKASSRRELSAVPPDVRRLIREQRYFQVLAPQSGVEFDEVSVSLAWQSVEAAMALVPQGQVPLRQERASEDPDGFSIDSAHCQSTNVEPFYMDRTAVSNTEFLHFVQAGGYSDASLWPQEILPTVLQFVDQTRQPGPHFWSGGEPDKDQGDHPVVGICWYEANAYAKWLGKQLPTAAQWQRAGTWSRSAGRSAGEVRYPWGNSFDPQHANLWASGRGGTVPVHALADGDTAGGIRQLIGNVWEWLNTQYVVLAEDGLEVFLPDAMAETRGGAFDTYFHSQATCQFRTGQPLTHRAANIGFRCCRALEGLAPQPQPAEAP